MKINRAFFSTLPGKLCCLLGLLLIGIVVYVICLKWTTRTPSIYTTELVYIGEIEKTVTSLGSLQPKEYVDVGAQVSGQLKKIHVEIGDTVTKGQLLAEIEPTVYASTVDADKASLADLQGQLLGQRAAFVLRQQEYKRIQALYQIGAASQKTLEEAKAAYTMAQSAVTSARAQVVKAESTLQGDIANLSYTKIYAPADGTVVSQTVLQGQTINSSQSAPTLLRIANLDVMTLNAEVAEADISTLSVGMPVYFTTLGHTNRRWKSTIRQILPTPTLTNNVVLYTVLVDVDNADRRLMTQMTAQVFFIQGQVNNLPIVPLTALQKNTEGTGYQLRVLTAKGPETRDVEVALSNRTQAALRSGVSAGERVINNSQRSPNTLISPTAAKI